MRVAAPSALFRAIVASFLVTVMAVTVVPAANAAPAPASAKTIDVSIPKFKFKPQRVTAFVPIQSFFIPQSRKTITVKSRKVKVLARGHKGKVQVYFPQFGWADVPYRYVKRTNTLMYDEFLRMWYQIKNDPLGGVEPNFKQPAPSGGDGPMAGGGAPAVRGLNDSERNMLNKINGFRESVGVPKLESCRNLNEIAFRWAELMIKYDNNGLSIKTENGRIFLTDVISESSGYNQGDGFKINGWYHILRPGSDPFGVLSENTLRIDEGYEHIAISHIPLSNGEDAWVIFFAKQGRCY